MIPLTAFAASYVVELGRTPTNYEKISVTTLAVFSPDPLLIDNATALLLTVENNSIRFRLEGTPSSTEGHLIIAGSNLYLTDKASIRNLAMIGIGGTATVYITYFKG
jgi:hypothetical protein